MDRDRLIEGIWERDSTIWTGSDEAHWLGWLDEPLHVQEQLGEVVRFAESLHDEVDDVVLCGMGGSSLAPEVLRRTFEVDRFHVLDTTHPRAIRALEEKLDLERTFFVSSSKSGTTLETRSHTDYFWEKAAKRGDMFAAVTDPGSELERLARERGFRAVFAGEPSIGGRYSALSPFGIVPAVLMGADAAKLLERAQEMREACRSGEGNPGYELGSRLGEGWREGRDKICIADSGGGFGLWAEQLIAESTGKHGKGLVPAPGEWPEGATDRQSAQPELPDPYALGAEFFRWEFAIAVAGTYLEINPFDQPDVQVAKDKTNEVLATGQEPELELEGSIEELLAQAQEGDYFCIQAFVEPGPAAGELDGLIADVRRRSGLVVTHGYGPRYMHSTGQLHKGGPNTGLFLQVIDDQGDELPIPGKPFGFRRLIRAQAAGDFETLKERGRRVARVRLEDV
ncbi:MAG: bifunctional transaldolase/phosoglucose isomerase [Gaiellaceae bacterium]